MDYIMLKVITDTKTFFVTMLDFLGFYNLSERDEQACKDLTRGDETRLADRPFTVARVH